MFSRRFRSLLPAALIAAGLLAAGHPATADTFRVTRTETEELPKILAHAVAGDSVLIGPGLYRGEFDVPAGVVVQSTAGADSTLLRGTFIATIDIKGKTGGTEIRGFTMVGRGGAELGVRDMGASPLIEKCIFKDLHDGVQSNGGEPVIRENTFMGCQRAIALNAANGLIDRNLIDGSVSGIVLSSASPTIQHNRISRGSEGIVFEQYSYPIIGGGLSGANDFVDNLHHLVNRAMATSGVSRTKNPAVVNAKYNYWGTECPPPLKFFGVCRIKPWTDEKHEKRITACPDGATGAGAGGSKH